MRAPAERVAQDALVEPDARAVHLPLGLFVDERHRAREVLPRALNRPTGEARGERRLREGVRLEREGRDTRATEEERLERREDQHPDAAAAGDGRAGARSAAEAVDVLLGRSRDAELDHGRDVGCEERTGAAISVLVGVGGRLLKSLRRALD